MNSNSSTLILVGVGLAVLLGLLFLSGGETQMPGDAAGSETLSVGDEGESMIEVLPTLSVEIGESLELGERETVLLEAQVQGAATGPIRYQWSSDGDLGFFSHPNERRTHYTAPSSCDCQEHVVITLTAIDGMGAAAVDTLYVTVPSLAVCAKDPCEPVCVETEPVCIPTEEVCPVKPDDPCPPEADIACDTPCIETAADAPCEAAITPCPCVEEDCTSTWMPSWPFEPEETPRPADRPKPLIVRHFPAHIPEGSRFQLRGTVSNPGCIDGCFIWSASKGELVGSETLTPIYHAPLTDRPNGETVSISLTLYDAFGGRSYDQVRVTIDNTDYDGPTQP